MRIFHGVVWSERALAVGAEQHDALKRLAERRPLWANGKVPQIIIAPSHQGSEDAALLFGEHPTLLLGPSTPLANLGSEDFDRYCKDTLRDGVQRLSSEVQGVVYAGPLGAIAPDSSAAEELLKELTNLGTVGFVKWQLDNGLFFYGPSLIQLAAKFLIAEGIRPERVLFVTSIRGDVSQSADAAALADVYAARRKGTSIVSALINVGTEKIGGLAAEGAEVFGGVSADIITDLGGSPSSVIEAELSTCELATSLSMHPRSRVLLRREDLATALAGHRTVAIVNRREGQARYHKLTSEGRLWSDARIDMDSQEFSALFRHGEVFDHRTGAICFDGYDWNQLVLQEKSTPWNELLQFYMEVLEEPWQRDRPNYRRILAAPTKILLRGEDYYANLRNISPAKRISDLRTITGDLVSRLNAVFFDYDTLERWKLVLGYLDYVRNAALQIAWLENQIGTLYCFSTIRNSQLTNAVPQFLDSVIRQYYAVLGGAREIARGLASQVSTIWTELDMLLVPVSSYLSKIASDWRTDDKNVHFEITKLIRRWREADHPGENMLVALHAMELARSDASDACDAVGIGWGGIELPIVYRQVAFIQGYAAPSAFAAHYSTYAKHGSKIPDVRPISPGASLEDLSGKTVILFDDNSLSGRTLQTIREHLSIKHGANADKIFLTRLSGERRYDQMRMDDHGLLDPTSIGVSIYGHLGETPFSRAWSRKDYENPIGVFSMAKRRILELLFSNSSADRFDREGF
jgi:hypothetical protein